MPATDSSHGGTAGTHDGSQDKHSTAGRQTDSDSNEQGLVSEQTVVDHQFSWTRIDYTPEGNTGLSEPTDHRLTSDDFAIGRTRVGSGADRRGVDSDVREWEDAVAAEDSWWDWLAALNSGYGDSDRAEYIRQESARRDLDIICDRLGAISFQTERAQYLLATINIKAEVLPSGPIEIALLAVASVAIDEVRTRVARRRIGGECEPDMSSIIAEDRFQSLCSDYGVSTERVRRARRRLTSSDQYEPAYRS